MNIKDKIIYIGPGVKKIKTGADVVNYRNERVLKELFGESFIKFQLTYSDNIFLRIFRKIFLYPEGLSSLAIARCNKIIREVNSGWIFICSSQYGRLSQVIRKSAPAVKIITYFHNIEKKYARDYLNITKPYTFLFYFLCCFNEYRSVKYSDICICINERDKRLMKTLYDRECDFIIPVSIDDVVVEDVIKKRPELHERIHSKKALFVGSNFFGNTQGLLWFIKEILPFVDIKLQIVGSGMSQSFTNAEKIEVYDFVDDLSSFYFNADFVILPIISGSGMKTKTAEALMYGKSIIGTSEAFEGYDLSPADKMFPCLSAGDFISAIKNIYNKRIFYFNQDIRDIFLKLYSTEEVKEKFSDIFK
jgi:glycosyltransferase involved in cell wall biosynthesis